VYCPECRYPVTDRDQFCGQCGYELAATEPHLAEDPQMAAVPPPNPLPVPIPMPAAAPAALSPQRYFGMLLLMCLPLINLIVFTVWSVGRKPTQRRNFARAALIFLLVVTLLAAFIIAWYELLNVLYPYGWKWAWQT